VSSWPWPAPTSPPVSAAATRSAAAVAVAGQRGRRPRTPLSGLVAAALVALVALFFSGTLRNLPQPVLAAIVIFAVTSLFKLAELRRLWRLHRGEFLVAVAALLGVLGAGLLQAS